MGVTHDIKEICKRHKLQFVPIISKPMCSSVLGEAARKFKWDFLYSTTDAFRIQVQSVHILPAHFTVQNLENRNSDHYVGAKIQATFQGMCQLMS